MRQLTLLQSAMVCYYKVRQVLLQNATAYFITKCDRFFILQSLTGITTGYPHNLFV